MDMKKLLDIVGDSNVEKQNLTESKGMQNQMIMQQYTKPAVNPVTKYRSNVNEYFKVVNNEMLNVLKEEQEQKQVEVKKIVDRVLERLNEGKTKKDAPKPRNFVAKNAVQSGAGAHKDKKKAAKQGDVKHKAKEIELAEMDKSQKGAPGWNISDDEPGKPEINLGPEKLLKSKNVVKSATKTLNKTMGKAHKKVKESKYGSVEVGAPVKVYSNVLKKPVFGKVVNIKEGRAYVQYNNTKIVMGHPIDSVQLNEDATTAAATTVAKAAPGVAGKMASRLVPGLGAAVGAYDAYDRAKKGDYIGAGLSGLGAVTSLIPGVGTAATMGLTGAQLARDYKMKTGAFAPDEAEAGQAATPAPGAMTPNPAKPALAGPQLQAMQKELAAAGAKNKDGTPLAVDGKMGPNTQGAMSDPKFAEIVKKYQAAPAQAATPATTQPAGGQAAAAARTVAPAVGAVAGQVLRK